MVMSSKILMSLLLVLTCFVSCICNTPPWRSARVEARRSPENQFLYFRLSLLLPSTFSIATPSCMQKPKSLIINGLHPVKANYRGIHGIDEQTLDKVKAQLLVYWPIMTSPEAQFNYTYFQMIYRKDGTSCDAMLKGEKYFAKAIELAKLHRQKIYEALSLHGTPPSPTINYTASDIRKAIRGYTHQQPQITCHKVLGIMYLYEIKVCFGKFGRKFINCHHEPPAKDCKNNQKIIIPPLDA